MKQLFTLLFFLLNSSTLLVSQGFDWQYSPRLPFKTPEYFIGLGGDANYLIHYGKIDMYEGYSDCCSFESGQGFGYSFNALGEYWTGGVVAITAGLGYSSLNGTFTAPGVDLPRIINRVADTVRFENKFVSSLNYIMFELGTKYRLFETHLHVGAGIRIGILSGSRLEHTERVVSPANYRFNDGSQERTITSGQISDLNRFFITPRIKFGYDLTVGLGMYASPNISIGFPVVNITDNADWKLWTFTFGLSVYRGL